MTHGTISTYTNHACRCDLCRRAWTEYRRATRGQVPDAGIPRWFDEWARSGGSL